MAYKGRALSPESYYLSLDLADDIDTSGDHHECGKLTIFRQSESQVDGRCSAAGNLSFFRNTALRTFALDFEELLDHLEMRMCKRN